MGGLYYYLLVFGDLLDENMDVFEHGARFWELTSDIAATVSFDGVILHISDSVSNKLGYTTEECIGKHIISFVKEEYREGAQREFELNLQGKESQIYNHYLVKKNGDLLPVCMITAVDKKYNRIYCLAKDLSFHKDGVRSGLVSNEVLQTAIKEATTGIAIFKINAGMPKPEITYTMVSEGYCSIVGLPDSELINKKRDEIGFDVVGGNYTDAVEQVISGCPIKEREVKVRTPNGAYKYVSTSAQRVLCEFGEYLIQSITDVTEINDIKLKILEQKRYLKDNSRKLEMNERAVSEIIESMAEDKKKSQAKLYASITELLEPAIYNLKANNNSPADAVKVLEAITTSLAGLGNVRVQQALKILSAKELEMTHLIRQGYSSKEIASILKIGYQTIASYRKNVRKKLGIQNASVNLRSYLMTLYEEIEK